MSDIWPDADKAYLVTRPLPDGKGIRWCDENELPTENLSDAMHRLKEVFEENKHDPAFVRYFYHRVVEGCTSCSVIAEEF